MKKGINGLCAAFVFVCLLAASTLAGPPPLPSTFYGQLTIPPETTISPNTTITAQINQITYTQSKIMHQEGTWVYTVKIPGDDFATKVIEGGQPGDTIQFYLNNKLLSQTATWQSGSVTHLDLNLASPIIVTAQIPSVPWFYALLLILVGLGWFGWQKRPSNKVITTTNQTIKK